MEFTKKDYDKLISYLYENQDKTYQKFQQKLINNNQIKVIGVRMPLLRKIAKNLAKNDYKNFIKYNTHKTHEEILLHGLVIGYIKVTKNKLEQLINDFMPYNITWASNDTTVSNLKIFKTYPINTAIRYLKSTNNWEIRFTLTLLLNYYINDKNIDKILKICNRIKQEDYYVMMANAWLISECYIKHKEKTLMFLKNNNLNKFTHNKAISKICDSYRVTQEEKDYLKTIKR